MGKSGGSPSSYEIADRARDEADIDTLIELLNGGEQRGRIVAARYLGELRTQEAVGPLTRTLRASDLILRVASISALAAIGDVASGDAIATIAREDPSVSPRYPAATALVAQRYTAATALVALKHPAAVEVLTQLATSDGPGNTAKGRRWAVRQLVQLSATEAALTVEASLKQRSFVERWRLQRELKKFAQSTSATE